MQAFMHLLVLLGALGYLLQMSFDIKNVGKRLYFLSLSGFPAKAIFLVSCVLVVFATALRLACLDYLEDVTWIIFVLLTAVKFLFFCRGFKTVGPFVLMLYKIIVRDLLRFFIIYCVIVIGFSQAFYIIFLRYQPDDPTFDIAVNGTIVSDIFESFSRMFIMSLNEFSVFYEQLNDCELAVLGKITFILFIVLVSLLLINMLIAMMTNTYEQISSNSLEWLRQWAAIVLMMEQSVDPVKRLEYQNAYSIPMKDRKRCALLLKIRLPEEKVEEQKAERRQQRQAFVDEYSYRRQLRGYDARNVQREIRKASAVIQTMQTVGSPRAPSA
uniref:Ion transport domain-containing protein n=2 Tax=Plectus sambesii TaxID=2011161 RepID=A0A914XNB4_9BILA